MNGYMQDVRIYKGIAKYSSSFSPPERSVPGHCPSLSLWRLRGELIMTAFDNIKTNNWPATSNDPEDFLFLTMTLHDTASLTESLPVVAG